MNAEGFKELVIEAIADMKGKDVTCIDVRDLTGVTDYMVFASGTSTRHVKSIAMNVVDEAKKLDLRPIGVEGDNAADWVLVDFGDLVVHVMLPETRAFYDLESLWSGQPQESLTNQQD